MRSALAGPAGIATRGDCARNDCIDRVFVAQGHQRSRRRQSSVVGIVVGIASCIPATGVIAAIASSVIAAVRVRVGITVSVSVTTAVTVSVLFFLFLFFAEFFVSGNGNIASTSRPVQQAERR